MFRSFLFRPGRSGVWDHLHVRFSQFSTTFITPGSPISKPFPISFQVQIQIRFLSTTPSSQPIPPLTMGGAEVKTAPYGTWTSPITSDIVSGSSLSFPEVHVDVNVPILSSKLSLTSSSPPQEQSISSKVAPPKKAGAQSCASKTMTLQRFYPRNTAPKARSTNTAVAPWP